MPAFHVIASIPRSGSTLLCNILNQNPEFHASSTSPLANAVASATGALSSRPEFLSMLGNDASAAKEQLRGASRGFIEGYYANVGARLVFDKDRSATWLMTADLLLDILPASRIFCLVRDPREAVASVLARQATEPLMRNSIHPVKRLLGERVAEVAGPQGLIGGTIKVIEDVLMQSKLGGAQNINFIKYEQLVADPVGTIGAVYDTLGEPHFPHDFTNVVNTATDQDFLYKNMWPHEGSGPVAPRIPRWPKVIPAGLAQNVMRQFTLFNQTFGYT